MLFTASLTSVPVKSSHSLVYKILQISCLLALDCKVGLSEEVRQGSPSVPISAGLPSPYRDHTFTFLNHINLDIITLLDLWRSLGIFRRLDASLGHVAPGDQGALVGGGPCAHHPEDGRRQHCHQGDHHRES